MSSRSAASAASLRSERDAARRELAAVPPPPRVPEAREVLEKGAVLAKRSRLGGMRVRYVWLSHDNQLCWRKLGVPNKPQSAGSTVGQVSLGDFESAVKAHATKTRAAAGDEVSEDVALERCALTLLPKPGIKGCRSVTLLFDAGSLVCSAATRDEWIFALTEVITGSN